MGATRNWDASRAFEGLRGHEKALYNEGARCLYAWGKTYLFGKDHFAFTLLETVPQLLNQERQPRSQDSDRYFG